MVEDVGLKARDGPSRMFVYVGLHHCCSKPYVDHGSDKSKAGFVQSAGHRKAWGGHPALGNEKAQLVASQTS